MGLWSSLNRIIKFCLLFLFLIFISAIVYITYLYVWDDNSENNYDREIILSAKRYNVDPNLIKAVIWKESSFRPFVIGSKKERGLMQIMEKHAVQDWSTYKKCSVPPPGILYSPEINIDIGTWYLSRCQSHWRNYKDNLFLTIAEYNAGYKNAKEWASNINTDAPADNITFPSTKKYVLSVMKKYQYYKTSDSKLSD